jgi:hypothetical protein
VVLFTGSQDQPGKIQNFSSTSQKIRLEFVFQISKMTQQINYLGKGQPKYILQFNSTQGKLIWSCSWDGYIQHMMCILPNLKSCLMHCNHILYITKLRR